MAAKWIEKSGLNEEARAKKIRTCKRIQLFGHIFLAITILAFIYLMFLEPPQNHNDAFLFAMSLSVCIAASFSLSSSMDTEIKFYELIGAIKSGEIKAVE